MVCFHKDWLPFMMRRRELVAEGVTGKAINDALTKEVEDGKLAAMSEPSIIHRLGGSSFNASTGQVEDSVRVWVVSVPNATSESLGLASEPVGPGVPWVMYAGTPGAHIMNSPTVK